VSMSKLPELLGRPQCYCAFCDIDHFLRCTMRTLVKLNADLGSSSPVPIRHYQPQAYCRLGFFYGYGIYWLVRQIERVSGAPPAAVHRGQSNTSVEISNQPQAGIAGV
jgi:hypothetical protein